MRTVLITVLLALSLAGSATARVDSSHMVYIGPSQFGGMDEAREMMRSFELHKERTKKHNRSAAYGALGAVMLGAMGGLLMAIRHLRRQTH